MWTTVLYIAAYPPKLYIAFTWCKTLLLEPLHIIKHLHILGSGLILESCPVLDRAQREGLIMYNSVVSTPHMSNTGFALFLQNQNMLLL